MTDADVHRSFAVAVIAREVMHRAVRILHAQRIPVMPLKGIYLQHFVYRDAAARLTSDVDLLVHEEDFARAGHALLDAGFTEGVRDEEEQCVFRAPGLPLAIDLHARIFQRGMFRMPTDILFERGTLDEKTFGAPVYLPDAYDVYAHLVGHFAKHGMTVHQDRHAKDFAELASARRLNPEICAAHLVACGLARAARYTLPYVIERTRDRFAGAVLAALPLDPIGVLLAAESRAILRRLGRVTTLGRIAAYQLNPSLASTAAAIAEAARHRFKRRPSA